MQEIYSHRNENKFNAYIIVVILYFLAGCYLSIVNHNSIFLIGSLAHGIGWYLTKHSMNRSVMVFMTSFVISLTFVWILEIIAFSKEFLVTKVVEIQYGKIVYYVGSTVLGILFSNIFNNLRTQKNRETS